ncbi:MAG: TonB-dependent receptor [Gammaproteobacteria bacterium]|nr:TonB-dependent receptor [Gammaproteobacteria bacterium]
MKFKIIIAVLIMLGIQTGVNAQQRSAAGAQRGADESSSSEEIVNYPASFFQQYNPNNALDMVTQIPGFVISDCLSCLNAQQEGGRRGFGAALGNVLINDRRPSAKQDSPSAILTRIPAASVDYIQLIRGQVRGIDLQGQTVVANIILKTDVPATVRWETFVRQTFGHGLAPGGSISMIDRIGNIEYNVGANARYSNFGDGGPENIFDANGNLTEARFDDDGGPGFDGFDVNTYLNGSTYIGENYVTLNTKLSAVVRDELLERSVTPVGGETSTTVIDTERRNLSFALGLDAERLLSEDLIGKGIFLLYYLDQGPSNGRRDFNPDGNMELLTVDDIDKQTLEAISRLEFTYAGWANHSVQFNMEGAFNSLDSALLQTEHAGGIVSIIDVPGSDSKVEEIRGDFLLNDTWNKDAISVEFGLGAEISDISQTGDAVLDRSFFFVKPYVNFTYSPSQQQQTRVRFARDVSQLDFNDFVTAVTQRDDDLTGGNPNLKPQATWQAEISHERRFGELGVLTLSVFHDWIDDVEDLLPLSPTLEAPGNIGNGRRWGTDIEATIPLNWTGLQNARIDARLRLQDSTVTDPVTGNKRVLSGVGGLDPGFSFANENDWSYLIKFRQDFREAQVSWGGEVGEQAERPRFKVDELDVRSEGVWFNAFVETTRWFGLRIRVEGINILNYDENRERTFFVGQRDQSPVDSTLVQTFKNGRRINLSISGSF